MFKAMKKITKTLVAGIFYYGGLFHLNKYMNNRAGRRLTILAYHRVTKRNIEDITASLPSLFVTEGSFIKQLEFIKRHFTIITFRELRSYARSEDIPPNALIITFDDGYEDNYTTAYPIMLAMNVRSVMFLTADKIKHTDRSSYWWDRVYYYLQDQKRWYVDGAHPELDQEVRDLLREFKDNPSKLFGRLDKADTRTLDRLLNSMQTTYKISNDMLRNENTILRWVQVQRMTREIEFGSHSCNHYNLTELDNDSLAEEVARSCQEIESNAGCEVSVFSYPGGNYDERVKRGVADAGYDFAVTTEVGVNDLSDRYALKRVSVWEGTSRGIEGKFSKSLFAFKLLGN